MISCHRVPARPQQATRSHQQTLQPQTRLAYTALAGVLVTSLAADRADRHEARPGKEPR